MNKEIQQLINEFPIKCYDNLNVDLTNGDLFC
jgi:hypothetical protein